MSKARKTEIISKFASLDMSKYSQESMGNAWVALKSKLGLHTHGLLQIFKDSKTVEAKKALSNARKMYRSAIAIGA